MNTPRRSPKRPTKLNRLIAIDGSISDRARLIAGYIRTVLAVGGIGSFVIGALVWIFFRDIAGAGLTIMAAAAGMLSISLLLSWRSVFRAAFGQRGRYGLNTAIIFITVAVLAGLANYLLFWVSDRSNPPGWTRLDTTATGQHTLSPQAINTLQNLREPTVVTAFIATDQPADAALWRETEDLLEEFRRRSVTQSFEYRRVDPELDPNAALDYGVRHFPALVLEAADSRRREILTATRGSDGTTEPFNENDVITGLLVVNQIKQKTVMFITGHGERLITDQDPSTGGWGFVGDALARENYRIIEGTVEELTRLLSLGEADDRPAVLILADSQQDLSEAEEQVLATYLQEGGGVLMALEPGAASRSPRLVGLLLRYGLVVGEGVTVDIGSSVASQPTFLQLKAGNGQMPSHDITQGFDVLYLPGSAFFGIAPAAALNRVPVTEERQPYIQFYPIGVSTLQSWSETGDEPTFNPGVDTAGPLDLITAVEAIAELNGQPTVVDGEFVTRRIVAIADADFASNALAASARNEDLLINSVNWLAEDFELITIRPKFREPRLLFLTKNERDFIRWSGWLLMPSLIGIVGLWTWWRKR